MLKKILITGSQGYLGKNLSSYLKKYDVFGIDIVDAKDKKYDQIDITNKKEMSKIINQIKPDVIIHTAALHNLKVCELEPKKSDQINYQPIEDMVEIINKSKLNAHFIFISSDYVFKGDTGHYNESDKTNPQTVYGKDKVKAENIIIKKLEKYSIIRTAAIFGRGGNNFFNFIVSSLKNNEVIDVYNDTFFTPTYIDDLTRSIKLIIEKQFFGIYHICGSSIESRYTFARKIAKYFVLNEDLIKPAISPREQIILTNSSLSSDITQEKLKIKFSSTDETLSLIKGKI